MFTFKQFVIKQQHCAMKVGTDGVLIGAWAPTKNVSNILDIGTGTGLIAIMMAQRCMTAHIDAIEIDRNAAKQALYNTQQSPWGNRICVYNKALNEFCPTTKYDLIVCNPPFFEQSLKSPDCRRTQARHNDTLPPESLIEKACLWLQPKGTLSIILPITESEIFIKKAYPKLNLTHETTMFSTPNTPKRKLLNFSLTTAKTKKSIIVIENEQHQFTEQYKALTKDFYLKF